MKKNWSRIGILISIILISIFIDQQTKVWAKAAFEHQDVQSYLWDTLRLLYTQNEGAFLSLGSDLSSNWHLILLKVFPVIMLTGLLFYTFLSKELTYPQRVAMALILGGGISNIYDRLLFGKVIDFMNMGIGTLRTGVFNFADVFIMIGIGLFVFYNYKESRKAKELITETNNEAA